MAKVEKTKGRLKPLSFHPWFKKNKDAWLALKLGKVVDIPDAEVNSVLKVFGDVIVKVNIPVKNTPTEGGK